MSFLKLLLFSALLFVTTGAQADFGNWFVANQRLSTPIDASTKKLSFRFTCQDNMNLSAVAVYCVDASSPPPYQIIHQTDEEGSTTGEPLVFPAISPDRKVGPPSPLILFPCSRERSTTWCWNKI